MSFLHDTTILPTTLQHGKAASLSRKHNQQQLRSNGSIASLISAVRNPVATIGDVLDGIWDGLTKEERLEKQRVENKKQILYVRLRTVGLTSSQLGVCP